jgi:two-component system sensor histidine kinase PilS (NtrC family)
MEPPADALTWRLLQLFNYYRVILAVLLFILFTSLGDNSPLGSSHPLLYWVSNILYALFAIAGSFTIRSRLPGFGFHLHTQMIVDILVLTLMMHASGGLPSGLGVLVVIAVAGGSMMLTGKLIYLYAALASIAVLLEQIIANLQQLTTSGTYTQAGLYGLTFFSVAVLLHVLVGRIRASEALARQRGIDLANMQQVNEYIIQNMQLGIIVLDSNDRVRLINRSAQYMLALENISPGTPLAAISSALQQQLDGWHLQQRTPEPIQPVDDAPMILPRFADFGGSERAGTLVFLEDTAEITHQSQQLKLASLGRLSASIAHEIRNPLGAISHATQLLGESEDLQKGDLRLIEIIKNHSSRMNTIIENVLQLSRREQTHPESLELRPWLEQFAREFCSINGLPPDTIRIDIEPENTRILFDANHLHQIIWNLCLNAVKYGTPEKEKLQIRLKGGQDQAGRPPYLDIIDNGPGIRSEAAEQIFEPFYTINREGTGLGLYLARELSHCNKARLNYLHTTTGGSTFRLSFHDPERTTL